MGEVSKTINYFQFNRIASNRKVDQKHVTELVNEIQKENLLHLFPILVNSAFEVIDGQHRLAAAEKLGLYIHYQVDDQINKGHIARVNKFSKNWNINDYINFWTKENQPGFDKLSSFMIENPLIPPSTIMKMLHGNNTTADLRQGIVQVDYYDRAVNICALVREYSNIIPFAYERNFVIAVMNSVKTKDYDHQEMRRQLEYQSRKLVKCVSVKQYTEMLEEIYNYKKSKNLLKFHI